MAKWGPGEDVSYIFLVELVLISFILLSIYHNNDFFPGQASSPLLHIISFFFFQFTMASFPIHALGTTMWPCYLMESEYFHSVL